LVQISSERNRHVGPKKRDKPKIKSCELGESL
jgi:hypothetical protein